MAQLRQGHGEGVCLILNELINQELVGRDFHFEEPAWGEAPAGIGTSAEPPADEVEEEMDSESEVSQASESHVCEATAERFDGAEQERGLSGSAAASALEQVHVANVDPEAWRAEVERVKPLLRISADALFGGPIGSWQATLSKTRELLLRSETLCQPLLLPEGIRGHCRQWRKDLEQLTGHEDRLNLLFTERAAEAASVRVDSAAESQAVAILQTSISNLSQEFSTISEELDKRKSEADSHTEEALDAEKLPTLKKAIQRMRDESRQLELRIGVVQSELMTRQRRGTARERLEAAAEAEPEWHVDADKDSH